MIRKVELSININVRVDIYESMVVYLFQFVIGAASVLIVIKKLIFIRKV